MYEGKFGSAMGDGKTNKEEIDRDASRRSSAPLLVKESQPGIL